MSPRASRTAERRCRSRISVTRKSYHPRVICRAIDGRFANGWWSVCRAMDGRSALLRVHPQSAKTRRSPNLKSIREERPIDPHCRDQTRITAEHAPFLVLYSDRQNGRAVYLRAFNNREVGHAISDSTINPESANGIPASSQFVGRSTYARLQTPSGCGQQKNTSRRSATKTPGVRTWKERPLGSGT